MITKGKKKPVVFAVGLNWQMLETDINRLVDDGYGLYGNTLCTPSGEYRQVMVLRGVEPLVIATIPELHG
jgi:hypothetical protein